MAEVVAAGGQHTAGTAGDAFPAEGGREAVAARLAGLDAVRARQRVVVKREPSHVVVVARAGTGKTTTLVEGVRLMLGHPTTLVPSPQQAAVWDALKQSAGMPSVCFLAFNKAIAEELQRRVPRGCDAKTNHSLGFGVVRARFGNVKVNQYRVDDLIESITGVEIRLLRRTRGTMLKATRELVGLAKMNLATPDAEGLSALASHYNVELYDDAGDYTDEVFDLVPRVLDACLHPEKDGCIDYDDMVWLPVALDLPVRPYDVLLVDESQDLNRAQQALVRKAGKRLVLCGDPRQAIYGFAGADAESMPRMIRGLSADARGCTVLPLTVTRRCGRAIVAAAQQTVPDFEAHESNPAGLVGSKKWRDEGAEFWVRHARPGDMVLCRTNAPLISWCLRLIRQGVKAVIRGRDVGQGLISLVHKAKAGSVAQLEAFVHEWAAAETRKEGAKRNPDEGKLIAIEDKASCVLAFADGADSVEAVVGRIERVFSDRDNEPAVQFSSIHKAKGLEARRVFILQPKAGGVPHPMARTAWQAEQERNLLYVAITRAIDELFWVCE